MLKNIMNDEEFFDTLKEYVDDLAVMHEHQHNKR